MKASKILFAMLALIACGATAAAQSTVITPYSRYGYGILGDNATAAQNSMGGVGYAMNSGRQINVMNPASYAAIDSLTFLFDMGVSYNNLWSDEGDLHEHNQTGGLDYITMSFPIAKWLGASVGLLPYSTTGYTFTETITNGEVQRIGAGNINQAYIGAGVTPLKNLYLGFNVAYMFGTTTNDVLATTSSSSVSLFERVLKVRDWRVDLGVQYDMPIGKEQKLTLGVAYSPGKDLHGETFGTYYDATGSKVDTVGYTKLNGLFSLPATYGAGVGYSWRNRLYLEADFTYQPWKDAKYANIEGLETMKFADRWKLAAGLQYTPSPRGGYWQRVQYRCGAYYNRDYQMIKGNNVREIGASIGFGLPVAVFKSVVSLGFEYKHRQATPNPLIKEQYFNITVGINFNEMWFRKSKIY